MPKYDAFGRELGENTLEGLGASNAAREKPVEWSADDLAKAQAAARAEAQVAAASPATAGDPLRAPETPLFQAPVAEPRPAAPQRPASEAAPTFVRARSGRRRRRAGLGCLGFFFGIPVLLGVIGAIVGSSVDKVATDLRDIPRPSESPEIAAPKLGKPAKPPLGLQARSLVRRANFARAVRKLRTAGLGSPSSLSIRPERIDAQLVTKGGRLRNVQLTFDGKLQRFGGASSGFKFVRTVPFSQINTAAPERLARTAARRLGSKTSRLDYLALLPGTGWGAYFKGSRIVVGDARGGFAHRIS